MSFKVVIGEGSSATEALLFARVNQIGFDKKIKRNTITCKTHVYEIPQIGNNYDSKIITELFFAYSYYLYLDKKSKKRVYTVAEQRYYVDLSNRYGSEIFEQIMDIYSGKLDEFCLAIKISDKLYKFLY